MLVCIKLSLFYRNALHTQGNTICVGCDVNIFEPTSEAFSSSKGITFSNLLSITICALCSLF